MLLGQPIHEAPKSFSSKVDGLWPIEPRLQAETQVSLDDRPFVEVRHRSQRTGDARRRKQSLGARLDGKTEPLRGPATRSAPKPAQELKSEGWSEFLPRHALPRKKLEEVAKVIGVGGGSIWAAAGVKDVSEESLDNDDRLISIVIDRSGANDPVDALKDYTHSAISPEGCLSAGRGNLST